MMMMSKQRFHNTVQSMNNNDTQRESITRSSAIAVSSSIIG